MARHCGRDRDSAEAHFQTAQLLSLPVGAGVGREEDRLLELVYTDAHAAEAEARRLLADGRSRTPTAIAKLQWVTGLSQRERGELDDAKRQLESARATAVDSNDEHLTARITSSLAFVFGQLGDLDGAVVLLEQAAAQADGADRALLRGQLGSILYWRGALGEAAKMLRESCDELAGHDEHVIEARYRGNLGAVLSLMGEFDEAVRQLRGSRVIAQQHGLDREAGMASANLGFVGTLRGDLPAAIRDFTDAEACYGRAHAESLLPRLHADHAQALADAGLFHDADALVRQAIDMYRQQGQQTELAGALLTSGEIRLAQDDIKGAIDVANEAADLFDHQGRESWAALATSLALQARARQDRDDKALPDALAESAEELARHGWPAESLRARLAAARLLAERGDDPGAALDEVTRRAATRGRSTERVLLAYIDARVASSRGEVTRARRAISRGLSVVASAQAALGSIETRAHAALHGQALAGLGARMAVADHRPRELLRRIEATRLMTSRMPALRPPDDAELAALLTELRSLNARLADASTTDEERREAERARWRAEREVRRRSRAARGDDRGSLAVGGALDSALAQLGDRQLLAHAAVDGRLYGVSVDRGRARLHELGELEVVSQHVEAIAFPLHRLNRQQGSDESRQNAAELLYVEADALAELLLPPVVSESLAPVVVVPTSVLHDVPWGLLPPLSGRPVSVNPSVTAWANAAEERRARVGARRDAGAATLLAGPGLEFAELEVKTLAGIYRHADVITGAAATGAACVDSLGRADLVHIACHGSFRTDNPMFSSLELADGPLIVHDLERLERLPETVVLSACSVAGAKALQGGSLLGLSTALTTLGACNVIAPLTPISDASAVTVMQRLHGELAAGATPAAALAAATMAHDVADPTAAAFIALGA